MKKLSTLSIVNLKEKQIYMAQAGIIAAKVHDKISQIIKPGINTLDLEKEAVKVIESNEPQQLLKESTIMNMQLVYL